MASSGHYQDITVESGLEGIVGMVTQVEERDRHQQAMGSLVPPARADDLSKRTGFDKGFRYGTRRDGTAEADIRQVRQVRFVRYRSTSPRG